MKKLLALTLAAALALSLVACGGSGDVTNGGNDGSGNVTDAPEAEEKGWDFYEGTEIPTFDSAMDLPPMQLDSGSYYLYDCGTSEDEAVEYMKLYAALILALGYEEVDSPFGEGIAIDTPYGTLIIAGMNIDGQIINDTDDHIAAMVFFDSE